MNVMLSKCLCVLLCITTLSGTANTRQAINDGVSGELVVQSGETNGVKLTVTMRRRFGSGESIPIVFTLENNRDDTIILDHSDTPRDIHMKLTNYKDEPMSFTPFGKRYDAGSPYDFTRNLSLHVDPHHTMSWRYNLEDYFVLPKAGYFRLYVLRTVDGFSKGPRRGGEDQEVDVGPVRFWVK